MPEDMAMVQTNTMFSSLGSQDTRPENSLQAKVSITNSRNH